MIRDPTSRERSILSTSSHSLELLRRAGSGRGPHAQLVSLAAQAVRAHDERCREYPRSGSSVMSSGTVLGELQERPGSYESVAVHVSEVYRPYNNYLGGKNKILGTGS
jgi:hypothetical protein